MNAAVLESIRVKGAAMPRPCSTCEIREPKDGLKTCQRCIDGAVTRRREQDRKRKERMRAYAAERVKQARAAGLCLVCKTAPQEPDKTCCSGCAEKKRHLTTSGQNEEVFAFRAVVRQHAGGWFPKTFAAICDAVQADWGPALPRRIHRVLAILIEAEIIERHDEGYRLMPKLRRTECRA